MTNMHQLLFRQKGLTVVELLIAMTISLVVVIAAAYMYLASREAQRVIDRNSTTRETGAFVIQLLGREIMNAGFYPATAAPIPADPTQKDMYDTYPPFASDPRVITDWANPATNWPPVAFQSGIYGCSGGKFAVVDSTCPSAVATAADTIVVNYFTSDTKAMGVTTGRRMDCTGANVGNDPSNAERKKNTGGLPPATANTGINDNLPPQLPLFVSNRFTLSDLKVSVENQDINTKSLTCSGNGKSPHGVADTTAYQPVMAGLENLKFTYGVYDTADSLIPARFYTAAEVDALPTLNLNGLAFTPWQRVTAVRVCVLTRTVGGNTRTADKAGAKRTYLACDGTATDQPAGDTILRFVETFGLRNALKQYY